MVKIEIYLLSEVFVKFLNKLFNLNIVNFISKVFSKRYFRTVENK